jgi:hypothetical protein
MVDLISPPKKVERIGARDARRHRFTEGFDTADLKDANALLDEQRA